MGRTHAEAEAPVFSPTDKKSQLIGNDPDTRNDWRQEEKLTIEDEMVGWHHRLNGLEFAQSPGDREGLACCSPWGFEVSDITEQPNDDNNAFFMY